MQILERIAEDFIQKIAEDEEIELKYPFLLQKAREYVYIGQWDFNYKTFKKWVILIEKAFILKATQRDLSSLVL